MLDIKPDNVFEFVDSKFEELKKAEKTMHNIIRGHAKKKESVFIYAYIAGHGMADVRQYFMLNTSDPTKALYPIEEQLRLRSIAGDGRCYVFTVYDICRIKADKIKKLAEEVKERRKLDEKAEAEEKKELQALEEAKQAGRGGEYTAGKKIQTNVFMLHGTVPAKAVEAKSHLCEDL